MRNFERNRGKNNIIESTPVLILLGIVVLIFAWSVLRFWNKMAETDRNKEMVENKAEALRGQKETLLSDLEKLQTDRGKEEFLRENFGLAKEGEEVIIIVEDNTAVGKPEKSGLSGFFFFFKNLLRR